MMRADYGVPFGGRGAPVSLRRGLLAGVVLAIMALAVVTSRAAAAPAWQLMSVAQPTHFSPSDGTHHKYELTITNVGSETSEGTITITDTLPNGIETAGTPTSGSAELNCTPGAGNSVVVCSAAALVSPFSEAKLGRGVVIEVPVELTGTPSGSNVVTMEAPGCGGAGQPLCPTVSNRVYPSTPPFELLGFGDFAPGASGAADTQAADHPVSFTAKLETPNELYDNLTIVGGEFEILPFDEAKDVVVDLPLGLVGDPLAAPRCPLTTFSTFENGRTNCPVGSQVGVFTLDGISGLDPGPESGVLPVSRNPIFNLVPERGYPAEFGMYLVTLEQYVVMYASVVPSPAGYVLRVSIPDILREAALSGAQATFFGNPTVEDGLKAPGVPFFTNPSDCSVGEPLTTTAHVDSWENPGVVPLAANGGLDFSRADFGESQWKTGSASAPAVTGCGALHFNASISAQAETAGADEPTGLTFALRVPQAPAGALGTPPLRTARVVLPVGAGVAEGVADGLAGCSDAEIALMSAAVGSCPEASQVGTVEIHTPLLDHVVPGKVFLGSPECGPCSAGDAAGGRMVRLFIQADDPVSGVVVKLAGRVLVDQGSGQLTAVFADNPQVPVEELVFRLKGGPRAPLATPQSCGVFTTMADLMPWSAPETPDATPSSSSSVTGGCGGGFAPAFTGGMVSPVAGAFSPFTVSLSRHDGEQDLSGVTVSPPAGLLGRLAGVARCGEPQANEGTCGEGSLIGHVQAAAGPGSHPLWVGGRVYLTGPYRGAPFGLSIVVPAVAGPFNLGTVVVRASISVDPHTGQITVVSDPFPQSLDGVQLRVQTVNVTIDRPGFMFNPTNCNPLQVTGSVTSSQGTTVGVSSPFAVAACRTLPFHPVFSVSTQAKTSKQNGASLTVKGTFPAGNTNTHSVAVVLPKQLPARLTTIQQACTEATFSQNPASCPAGSNIGTAMGSTPVLATPVVGPVYLVSHGGAAFPDVVAVLQAEGVTIDLVGSINIKKGITSSDFASVPDAPITSFTMNLPEGLHSGLTAILPAKAKGSMCATSLTMPFTITGQNGAQVKQNLKIAVTGCPKPKKKKTKTKPKHPKKK